MLAWNAIKHEQQYDNFSKRHRALCLEWYFFFLKGKKAATTFKIMLKINLVIAGVVACIIVYILMLLHEEVSAFYLPIITAIIVDACTKMLEKKCRIIYGQPGNHIITINESHVLKLVLLHLALHEPLEFPISNSWLTKCIHAFQPL
jgi:hypothetical protein